MYPMTSQPHPDHGVTSVTVPARARRVTKRRAETRARLLDAAFRVIATEGWGRTRIDDVCAAAGYTRGAFYSQFASLDELFFVLYDQRAAAVTSQVATAFAGGDAETFVDALVERATRSLVFDRQWLLVHADFRLYAARHPEVAARFTAHRDALVAALQRELDAVGLEAPAPLHGTADAARAIAAVYDGVAAQLVLDGDVDAARAELRRLLTALLGRPLR